MMGRALIALFVSLVAMPALGAEGAETEAQKNSVAVSGGWTFELKMGSFRPDVDATPGLTGRPYGDTFCGGTPCTGGKGRMLMASLEVDRYIFRHFGSLGVGLSIAYAEKYGSAVYTSTGQTGPTRSGLSIFPIKLLAVYRFDYPALRWNIPVIPFVKAGLDYDIWWTAIAGRAEMVTLANGKTSSGKGVVAGLAFTGGISFLLDILEPRLASDMAADLGFRHTYLFAEFNDDVVTGLGKPSLDLSARTFLFGLAFDF